jgi:protein-tyrosine-phosphatase
MAETFANAYGSDLLEAESAGFRPAKTASHTAQRLMSERGLTMPDTTPRRFRPAELDGYDLIVNLCEYGLPKTSVPVLKIGMTDPVGRPEQERREIRDEIETIVLTMLAQFRQAREEWPWNVSFAEESSEGGTGAEDKRPQGQAILSWWRTPPTNVQLQLEGLPV